MVDLVGIEPTTSSMPCSGKNSRAFVFSTFATGTLVGKWHIDVSGQISGQKINT